MAEKKSAISYESVMKSLKAREFAPVYVLMGDEPFYIAYRFSFFICSAKR